MSCSKPIAVVRPFSPNQEEAKEAVNLIKIASTEMTEYITSKLGRGTRYVTISSIVAAIMGTMSAIRASMKVGFKESFLHYASILTQLNSFVASMALLFKEEGISFSKKRALEAVSELTAETLGSTKSNSAMTWILPVIVNLVAIILAGLTLFKVVDIKHVINGGSALRAIKTIKDSVGDVTNYILEDLFKLDVTGNVPYYESTIKLAQRSVELASLPYHQFVSDPKLYKELLEFTPRVIDIVNKKTDNKTAASVKQAITVLNNNIHTIREKISAVQEALSANKRQETLGVYLAGEPAVGKSSLANYIWSRVSDRLGYSPDIYNLAVNNENAHFQPYALQHCGVYDEFYYARTNDPMIKKVTSIVSGDHFNLAGAALEHKTQPANFKMVFFTSNVLTPELTTELSAEGARAFWDRFMRIEVLDPKPVGRFLDNEHRQPDFSHLTLRYWKTNSITAQMPQDAPCEEMKVSQLIDLITKTLAKREVKYLRGPTNTYPEEYVQERLRLLEPRANAGRNFFVVRYQGEPGTGKTRDATNLAVKLSTIHNLPIVYVEDFNTFTQTPSVCVVDDILHESEYSAYFEWVNKTHIKTIVIIATNHIIPIVPTRWGFGKKVRYVRAPPGKSGITRRLGLEGEIRNLTEKQEDSVSQWQYTIDKKPGNFTQTSFASSNVEECIIREYNRYLTGIDGYTVLRVPPPDRSDYDLKITVSDITELRQLFSSKQGVIKAFFTKQISVNPALVETFKRVPSPSHLLPAASVEDMTHVEMNFEGMVVYLAKRLPNITISLTIGNRVFAAVGNTLYFPPEVRDDIVITHDMNNFRIEQGTNFRIVPLEPFIVEYYNGTNIVPTDFDLDTYAALVSYIKLHWESEQWKNMALLHAHKKEVEEAKSNFSWSPFIIKVLAALIGLYALFKTVSAIKKMFNVARSNSLDEENGVDSERFNRINHLKDKFWDAMRKGGRTTDAGLSALRDIREQADRESLRNVYEDWADTAMFARSNFLDNIRDEQKVERFITEKPKLAAKIISLSSSAPNQLTLGNLVNPSLRTTHIHQKLAKNYCRVTNSGRIGRCYALGYKANLLMTVSHMFDAEGEMCSVDSADKTYCAKVVKLMRDRDLAIIQVTDRTFPPFADITSMFVKDAPPQVVEAMYIRPIPGEFSTTTSKARYHEKVEDMTDPGNKRYCPTKKILEYSIISVRNTLRDGDCGLPLVVEVNNEYKIIGLHNAYHAFLSRMFFSAVTSADFSYSSNSMESTVSKAKLSDEIVKSPKEKPQIVVEVPKKTKPEPELEPEFTIGSIDYYTRRKLNEPHRTSRFEKVSDLNVVGYSRALHLYSNPTHKKVFLSAAGTMEECPSLPSCTDTSRVRDFSNLVKDRFGVPSPLFTQAVKYSLSTKTSGQYDKRLLDITCEYVKTYYEINYAEPQDLRINWIINGFRNLKGLDLTTSAGPKMKQKYRIHTKEPLFVNCSDSNTRTRPFYQVADLTDAGKELLSDYFYYEASIDRGEPVTIVCRDNAKVEYLPKEKVYKGKVRLFNEIDLSINMLLKKYFGYILESMITKHVDCIYAIGYNPYLDATHYNRQMERGVGELISTDFESLDKTIPADLIQRFVRTTLYNKPPEVQEAIAQTLSFTIHNMDGDLYTVNGGNESGSYVTTMLNCFCVHVTSWYTFIRKFEQENLRVPTYDEIMTGVTMKILGDDCIRRMDLGITFEDLKQDAALFNLRLTPAKQDGALSFCSREYIVEDGIVYPALKRSSIETSLFYVTEETPDKINQNVSVALFEASLHPEPVFNEIRERCLKLIRHYNLTPEMYSYTHYRQFFRMYVLGFENSPVFQETGNPLNQNKIYSVNSNTKLTNKNFTMATSWLNDYLNRHQLHGHYDESYTPQDGEWICNLEVETPTAFLTAEGKATTKRAAKKLAAEELKETVSFERPVETITTCDGKIYTPGRDLKEEMLALLSKIRKQQQETLEEELDDSLKDLMVKSNAEDLPSEPNPQPDMSTIGTLDFDKMCKPYTGSFEVTIDPLSSELESEMDTIVDNLLELATAKNQDMAELATQSNLQPTSQAPNIKSPAHQQFLDAMNLAMQVKGVEPPPRSHPYAYVNKYVSEVALLHERNARSLLNRLTGLEVKSNADIPIEPATMGQAAKAQSIAEIPSQPNPQPTAQVPAMTSSGEDVIAAVAGAQVQQLNPIGAPDMTTVGGIQFDIKSLIHQQFLDSDTEIEINADLPAGSIIAQIPYSIRNNPYLNRYAVMYGSLHERYTGSMLFCFTVIGNMAFSGSVGIAWMPHRIDTATYPVSELQKYCYSIKGVTLPWNVIHQLHDARQDGFYRTLADDDNLDKRPHLVMFLHMSLQNPYQKGVITRVRVSSMLANATYSNPFRFMNPVFTNPQLRADAASVRDNFETQFDDFLPEGLNHKIWFYLDGFKAPTNLNTKGRPAFTYDVPLTTAAGTRVALAGALSIPQGATTCLRYQGVKGDSLMTLWADYIHPYTDETEIFMNFQFIHDLAPSRFAKWMEKNAKFGGFIPTARVFIPSEWERMKTYVIPDSDILTHSLTYNDTQVVVSSWNYSTSTTLQRNLMGWRKWITSEGTIICFGMTTGIVKGPGRHPEIVEAYSSFTTIDGVSQQYPILQIEAAGGYTSTVLPELPTNYRLLRITDMPPTSVAIEGFRNPTATDNATLLSIFAQYNDLPITMCPQFSIIDNRSVSIILRVRYLQEYRIFVVATLTPQAYLVVPQETRNMTISNVSIVERTTDFQMTNTDTFVNREGPSFTSVLTSPVQVKSNAWMALVGGGLSGVGQGLSQMAQREHDQKMQEAQFSHNKEMQQYGFGHELSMQNNMFQFNREVLASQQDFAKMMQQSNFDYGMQHQEREYQNIQHTNALQSQNRLMERGLSARSLTLTSAMPGTSFA